MPLHDTITLFLALLTLFVYFAIASRRSSEIQTMDDFFFYGRRLDKSGYEKTFVVTGISLATVLFFFLDYGGVFGLPLILSPLMFCLGTYVFYRILPVLKDSGFLENGSTLHNFIGQAFRFEALRYSSAFISILGYLGIFVIELYVGVKIFNVFFSTQTWTVIIALFLMSLVFVFVYFGGFKAVIDTDKIQFLLIVLGTLLTIISLIVLNISLPQKNPVRLFPFPGWLPLPFVIVMVVGNVPFQILRMAHWQRAAAVGDIETIRSGLKTGIVWTFIFWLLFCVMGLLLYWISTLDDLGAIVLLDLLRRGTALYNLVIYPLLFSAFVAALISTSDSVFISILTSYIYDFRHHKELHDENGNVRGKLSSKIQKKGLKSSRRAIAVVLTAGGLLYYLLVEILEFQFVDLLFVFFNQQLSLFPAVILAVKGPNGMAYNARWGAMAGIWTGWLAVWVFSIYGKQTNNANLVLLAAAIGWIVSIIVTVLVSPKVSFSIMRRR